MKNTDLIFSTALPSHGVPGLHVHNLQPYRRHPSSAPAGLKVAPAPSRFIATGAWKPVGEVLEKGKRMLLLSDTRSLAVADPEATALLRPRELEGVVTDSEIRCCMTDTDGSAILMTGSGARRLRIADDGTATLTDCFAEMPPVVLRAEDVDGVEEMVPERVLEGTYNPGSALRGSDRDDLTRDMAQAYHSLCRRAEASAVFVQPLLGRVRLYDRRGVLLGETPPVLLGHSAGPQCTGIMEAPLNRESRTVSAFAMRASTWRPVLEVSSAAAAHPAASLVAYCEVWLTPQFHPYDPKSSVYTVVGKRSDGSTILRAYIPGSEMGLSSTAYGISTLRVKAAVARMDALESKVAVVSRPLAAARFPVTCDLMRRVTDEVRRMDENIWKAAVTVDRCSRLLMPPHAFTAGCCTVNGDTVCWGDLSALRFGGFPAESYARATATGAWHGNVAVEFADGSERVVCASEGLDGAPLSFGPLLAYPAADAVTMTVTVSRGGKLFRRSFALEAEPSGRYAVYVSPDFRAVELEEVSGGVYAVPAARKVVHPVEGSLLMAPSSAPLRGVMTARGLPGTLRALQPLPAGNQAWEFGRSRILCATDAGLYQLTADMRRLTCALRLFDDRAVERPDAVCRGRDCLYLLVRDCGGRTDLVAADSRTCKTLLRSVNADICAYNSLRDEIMLADSGIVSRDMTVVVPAEGHGVYSADSPKVTAFACVGGCSYGTGEDGSLMAMDRGQLPLSRDVSLTADSDCGGARVHPAALLRDMSATSILGTLTVSALRHDGSVKCRICRLTLSGALRSALRVPLVCLPQEAVRLELSATVSSDFAIRRIVVVNR